MQNACCGSAETQISQRPSKRFSVGSLTTRNRKSCGPLSVKTFHLCDSPFGSITSRWVHSALANDLSWSSRTCLRISASISSLVRTVTSTAPSESTAGSFALGIAGASNKSSNATANPGHSRRNGGVEWFGSSLPSSCFVNTFGTRTSTRPSARGMALECSFANSAAVSYFARLAA